MLRLAAEICDRPTASLHIPGSARRGGHAGRRALLCSPDSGSGWIRPGCERQISHCGRLNSIDKIFIVWACYRVFASIATNWPVGASEQMAFLLSCLCGYFLVPLSDSGRKKTLLGPRRPWRLISIDSRHQHGGGTTHDGQPLGAFLGGAPFVSGDQKRRCAGAGHLWPLDSGRMFRRHADPSLCLAVEEEGQSCGHAGLVGSPLSWCSPPIPALPCWPMWRAFWGCCCGRFGGR